MPFKGEVRIGLGLGGQCRQKRRALARWGPVGGLDLTITMMCELVVVSHPQDLHTSGLWDQRGGWTLRSHHALRNIRRWKGVSYRGLVARPQKLVFGLSLPPPT
jgi:hypothetical protein